MGFYILSKNKLDFKWPWGIRETKIPIINEYVAPVVFAKDWLKNWWNNEIVNLGEPQESNYSSYPIYSTYEAVVASAIPGTLIVVWPGDYEVPNTVEVTKTLLFRGMGNDPTESRIINENGNKLRFSEGCQCFAENIEWREGYGSWRQIYMQPTSEDECYFNKCYFSVRDASSHVISLGGDPNPIRFKNCRLDRGYNTFCKGSLNGVVLDKCYTPSYSTYDTSGSLTLDDKVTSPTGGYGYEYNNVFITFNI